MKIRPLTLVILVAASVAGACLASPDPPITVTGKKYTYEIPRHLEKNYSSILYPGNIDGDETVREVLLLLSHEDFPTIALQHPRDATLHLLWDRDYGADGGIVPAVRRMLEDAEFAGRAGAYWMYSAPLGTLRRTYYLNFDPTGTQGKESDRQFYVKTLMGEPLEIGNIKKTPNLSCSLHSVHDGVLVVLGISGPTCENKRFDSLHVAMTEMFQRWQP